jgi:hypothetical protein
MTERLAERNLFWRERLARKLAEVRRGAMEQARNLFSESETGTFHD